jgi:membrane protease YdiL (CAAX protease family)
MKRLGPLGVVVTFLLWFPLVALEILLGVAFGWQVPVAIALGLVFLIAVSAAQERSPGKVRATLEFVAFSFAGGVVGGLLFGGLGAIFGFVFGFIGRLSQVPTTKGVSFRFLRRKPGRQRRERA